MPTALHEVIAELFRQRPTLAAELLTLVLDDPLPEFDRARTESGDFPDIKPTEYRADAVVVLTADAQPTLAVVVEVQLRPDPDKSWSWPVYITTLRARLRCPTVLLVLCPTDRVAAVCRRPIAIGPGCVLQPIVMSPANVPVVTDRTTVTHNPELAVLSAIAHRDHPDQVKILTAFADSVVAFPDPKMYIDLVMAALPKVTRHLLESIMTSDTHSYMSDFARQYETKGREEGRAEGREEGRLEGEATALLTILRIRFSVPESVRQEVVACTDPRKLARWIERTATAENLEAVFAE